VWAWWRAAQTTEFQPALLVCSAESAAHESSPGSNARVASEPRFAYGLLYWSRHSGGRDRKLLLGVRPRLLSHVQQTHADLAPSMPNSLTVPMQAVLKWIPYRSKPAAAFQAPSEALTSPNGIRACQ
jgi:hypothetical protein